MDPLFNSESTHLRVVSFDYLALQSISKMHIGHIRYSSQILKAKGLLPLIMWLAVYFELRH